jgi:hypothetical protein
VVAQIADQEGLGAFEVAFSVYLFASGCSRALGAEPLLVRHSDTDTDDLESAAASAVGTSLVAGVAFGLLCLAGAAVIGGPLRLPLAALGLTLPALLVQDAWRYVFFAAGRPAKALVNDVVWAVVQLAAVVWLLAGADPSIGTLVLAWGASAGVAALLGMAQTRLVPRPSAARAWLHRQRDLVPRFLGEFVVGQGASQLSIWLIVGVSSLGVVGALRAAGVLVGPARLFLTAAPGAAIPELIRIRRRSPQRFERLVALMSWGLAISVMAWIAFVLAIPDRYGSAVLKENWEPGRRIFVLVGLSWAALGLGTGAMVALRVLADAKGSFRARLLICPAIVVVPTVTAAIGDEMGVAAGLAAVALWSAGVWWAVYRTATKAVKAREAAEIAAGPALDQEAASVTRPAGAVDELLAPDVQATGSPPDRPDLDRDPTLTPLEEWEVGGMSD